MMRARTTVVLACAVLAAGCAGDTRSKTEVTKPTDQVESAETAKVKAAFRQLEFALLACHAERETFVDCELPRVPEVTIGRVTVTTFELTAGDLISRYDATKDTVPCHSTISEAAGCVAW